MVVEMMAKVVEEEEDVVDNGKDSLLSMPPPLCLLLCLFPRHLPHLPLQLLHSLPLLPDLLLLLLQVGVVLQTHADCFLEELVLADADAAVVCLAMSDIFICTWKLKLTLVLKSFLKRLESGCELKVCVETCCHRLKILISKIMLPSFQNPAALIQKPRSARLDSYI